MFVLDSRLQQDCLVLGDLPLCRVLLSRDANYPWFILVPRRADICEVFDLKEVDQQQLWREVTALAAALKLEFTADKMNVATLGNVVSQLHVHVVVRHRADVAWPAPIWGKVPALDYPAGAVDEVRRRVAALALDGFEEA
ncbi:HIT domain-containing protein [Pseudomonas sp. S75]|uniref:HIT domain-containing protein n=1 Tax=unclassified Pseudomonas TaxID=196821 RepID=UPI00190656F8|nr:MULTISPECIES: HIT domain-containing protein [unclassified Pseudomonas]MBJ9975470.1 HIT domain-containing protein [Pseudomonas sp. S30]MBK0155515.1 HIT domain-containing protein [Pseudomonas sp. S75]